MSFSGSYVGASADINLANILPTAPVNFNNQRITNVANPVGAQDVVTLDYFDNNPPSGVANIQLSNILPNANVSFNSQKLVDVANPTNPQDVLTLDYFNNNPPAGVANIALSNILPTAAVDFNSQRLINLANPVNPQDALTLDYFTTNTSPGAANQFLSNLLSPVNINQDLRATVAGLWRVGTNNNLLGQPVGMDFGPGDNSGGVPSTHRLIVRTGNALAGASGTGDVEITSGNFPLAGAGATGPVSIRTGQLNLASGVTGAITMATGTASAVGGGSGAVNISSGNSVSNQTGNISLTTGTTAPPGIRGEIQMTARQIDMSNTEGALIVPVLALDPAILIDGSIWYNSTDDKLRLRANGVTVDLN